MEAGEVGESELKEVVSGHLAYSGVIAPDLREMTSKGLVAVVYSGACRVFDKLANILISGRYTEDAVMRPFSGDSVVMVHVGVQDPAGFPGVGDDALMELVGVVARKEEYAFSVYFHGSKIKLI